MKKISSLDFGHNRLTRLEAGNKYYILFRVVNEKIDG